MNGSATPAAEEAQQAPDHSTLRESLRLLWEILTGPERRRFRWVLFGMLCVGVVETAGVGTIAPFVAILADPGIVERSKALSWIYETLSFESESAFMLFIGGMVLAVIVLGNALAAGVTWFMLRFVWDVNHRLSVALLNTYVRQPYLFFTTKNTSDLSAHILQEVGVVTTGMVIPVLKALSRVVVGLGIMLLLIWVDPVLVLATGSVLGGMYALTFLRIRKVLGIIGVKRLNANTRRFRGAGEVLQGIKDLKILGRERELVSRFGLQSDEFSRHSANSQIISTLPRYALETLAFGGIVGVLLVLMAVEGDFASVIPIVSLYAVAGYRLMPAMQQAYLGVSKLRFYSPSLITVHRDLTTLDPEPAPTQEGGEPIGFQRTVALDRVTFAYPGQAEPATRDVSLEIRKKQTVAFVGSTGCGKTTLVDLIMGLLIPRSGVIQIDGRPLDASNVRSWQRLLGYIPQQIFLADDSIANNIAFGVSREEVDPANVERAARIANLHEFVEDLPEGYATVVGDRGIRFSGGQRQRIGIARALYHDPELLIMDEATSALDGVTEDAVMDAIGALSHEKTIILIAHRLRTVKEADVIFIMREGKIVQSGTYDELVEQSAEFRAMAGFSTL